MSGFTLSEMRSPTPWALFRMRDALDLAPTYQREGGIWTLETRQLLIDTILNRFDVPKIYLHKYTKPQIVDGKVKEYAVIDGKQRLETIFKFIEGDYALPDKFEYYHADDVDLSRLTYSEIASRYPDIKTDFDAAHLDIVVIETDDTELIEELFSRLNEAVPLNAAEKRNARSGQLPVSVRRLCCDDFWISKLPFGNRRYRHYDLAAKMLYVESRNSVVDTKKAYLDRFFIDNEKTPREHIEKLEQKVRSNVAFLTKIFIDKDPLLRSVGMVIIYYHLANRARELGLEADLTRARLLEFEDKRRANRVHAEKDIASANYNLLEFDRYVQSPNDAIANRFKLAVIDDILFDGALGFELPESAIAKDGKPGI